MTFIKYIPKKSGKLFLYQFAYCLDLIINWATELQNNLYSQTLNNPTICKI